MCISVMWNYKTIREKAIAHLLVGIHGGETTMSAGLAAFLSDGRDFILRTVGKVAGISVGGHDVNFEIGYFDMKVVLFDLLCENGGGGG